MSRRVYAKADLLSLPQERTPGRYRSRSVGKPYPASPTIGASRESHSASDLHEAHDDGPKIPDSAAVYYLEKGYDKCLEKLLSAKLACEGVGNDTEIAENLTCSKIARLLDDHSTKLRIWGFESKIDTLPDQLNTLQRQTVDLCKKILGSLEEAVSQLESQCRDTSPNIVPVASEEEYDEDEELSVSALLKAVEMQLRSLARLSAPLRAAADPVKVMGFDKMLDEMLKYFGSPEALKRYEINEDFKGHKALEEARANAENLGIAEPFGHDSEEEYESADARDSRPASKHGSRPDSPARKQMDSTKGKTVTGSWRHSASGYPSRRLEEYSEHRTSGDGSRHSRPSSPRSSRPTHEGLPSRHRYLLEQRDSGETLSDILGIGRKMSDLGRQQKGSRAERPLREYHEHW